jgi:hypothetical protein
VGPGDDEDFSLKNATSNAQIPMNSKKGKQQAVII